MEKEDIIKDKSMDFAIRVVNLCKYLKKEKQEYEISKGALQREAMHAESQADFIHKFAIAQKECNITRSIKTAKSHIPS